MTPLDLPSSSPYTLSSAERRTSLRFRSNLKVTCQPARKEEIGALARSVGETDYGLCSQGKDISTHGIGLVCSQRLDPGTILNCRFLNLTTRFICSRPVQVVRITPQADDKWLAGCRFAQELEYSELLGLL